MTREGAIIILGNIPIDGDECYSIPQYQQAKTMAIEALEQLTSYEQTINKLTKAISEQEPKTGHWIAQDIHNCHTDFKCSECGYIHSFMHLYGKPTADYTYCPNCGARMESAEC